MSVLSTSKSRHLADISKLFLIGSIYNIIIKKNKKIYIIVILSTECNMYFCYRYVCNAWLSKNYNPNIYKGGLTTRHFKKNHLQTQATQQKNFIYMSSRCRQSVRNNHDFHLYPCSVRIDQSFYTLSKFNIFFVYSSSWKFYQMCT